MLRSLSRDEEAFSATASTPISANASFSQQGIAASNHSNTFLAQDQQRGAVSHPAASEAITHAPQTHMEGNFPPFEAPWGAPDRGTMDPPPLSNGSHRFRSSQSEGQRYVSSGSPEEDPRPVFDAARGLAMISLEAAAEPVSPQPSMSPI